MVNPAKLELRWEVKYHPRRQGRLYPERESVLYACAIDSNGNEFRSCDLRERILNINRMDKLSKALYEAIKAKNDGKVIDIGEECEIDPRDLDLKR